MKDENVIYVERKVLEAAFDMPRQYWQVSWSDIDALPFGYLSRSVAENDFDHKQLIPYAVVQNWRGDFLCYQRHGSERRLSEFYSVGIGGHVNDTDCGEYLSECLLKGLQREFCEEVGTDLPYDRFQIVGMINEEQTAVGHCHTGVVFKVLVDNVNFTFDAEIGNPQWKRIEDLDLAKFELWSALALKLLFSIPKIEI